MVRSIIRIAPVVLAAGVLLCGCGSDAPQTDLLSDIAGTWDIASGTDATARFDQDVAFLDMDGARLMVRLEPVPTCDRESGPRLAEVTVEHSPDDASALGQVICWRFEEIVDGRMVIHDVAREGRYELTRRPAG